MAKDDSGKHSFNFVSFHPEFPSDPGPCNFFLFFEPLPHTHAHTLKNMHTRTHTHMPHTDKQAHTHKLPTPDTHTHTMSRETVSVILGPLPSERNPNPGLGLQSLALDPRPHVFSVQRYKPWPTCIQIRFLRLWTWGVNILLDYLINTRHTTILYKQSQNLSTRVNL